MTLSDIVELGARNLRQSMLRNSLTTLGIGVGVASMVAMLSLGVGLQQLFARRIERAGLFDTVIVSRSDFGNFGPRARAAATADTNRDLDEGARREISALAGVLEVVPDLRTVAQFRYNGKSHRAMIASLPMSAHDREAFESLQGSFFSSGGAAEAIVQRKFAEQLMGLGPEGEDSANPNGPEPAVQPLIGAGLVMSYAQRMADAAPPNQPPASAAVPTSPGRTPSTALPDASNDTDAQNAMLAGFSVVPRTQKLRIVGIFSDDPETFRGLGRARVFIPLEFAEKLQIMLPSDVRGMLADRGYTQLTVRVRSPRDVPHVEEAIHRMGFGAFSLLDASRNLQRFFAVLDLFLGIFGSLALAVASLGIVNTLVMAILERRREIGILKALGASDADVKALFFAEAAAMGLVGGALGVIMGWVIGKAINAGTNIYLHRQNLPSETFWSVPWWLVLGAVAFSVAVSLAAGLYPAARAAKLDPVKALRYE